MRDFDFGRTRPSMPPPQGSDCRPRDRGHHTIEVACAIALDFKTGQFTKDREN
jgi:hypothetical protein